MFSVTKYDISDIADSKTVDKYFTCRNSACDFCGF